MNAQDKEFTSVSMVGVIHQIFIEELGADWQDHASVSDRESAKKSYWIRWTGREYKATKLKGDIDAYYFG